MWACRMNLCFKTTLVAKSDIFGLIHNVRFKGETIIPGQVGSARIKYCHNKRGDLERNVAKWTKSLIMSDWCDSSQLVRGGSHDTAVNNRFFCRTKCNVRSEIQCVLCNIFYINLFSAQRSEQSFLQRSAVYSIVVCTLLYSTCFCTADSIALCQSWLGDCSRE